MRFLIPDPTGHTTVEFDKADPKELKRAEEMFDNLVKEAHKLAYGKKDGKAYITRELDPTADDTVFFAPLQGG